MPSTTQHQARSVQESKGGLRTNLWNSRDDVPYVNESTKRDTPPTRLRVRTTPELSCCCFPRESRDGATGRFRVAKGLPEGIYRVNENVSFLLQPRHSTPASFHPKTLIFHTLYGITRIEGISHTWLISSLSVLPVNEPSRTSSPKDASGSRR